jgi:hypothetical protein
MITDSLLIKRVQTMIASKPRKHVTAADVLAVIQKESSGIAVFDGTEPLFVANLRAAARITGLSKEAILNTVRVNGVICKFRCEPGYWAWASKLKGSWTAEERFLLSCSFGLGQKMARWLVSSGIEGAQWIAFIRKFNADLNLQIQYVCGDLDALLVGSGGNRLVAFTRYNQGTRDANHDGKADEIISDYGKIVNGYRTEYQKRGY